MSTETITRMPVLEALEPFTTEACDACGAGTAAAVLVILPLESGKPNLLSLCGHHARKLGFGYEHPVPASRLTGSVH